MLWPAEGADPGDRVRDFAASLQVEAEKRFGRGRARLRAGLGSFHPGLRGISRSYLEAQQAVDLGRKLKPDGGVQHHDELVPYLVLVQNPLLAERYVNRLLGRLLAAERPGKGSLIETLEAYLTRGSVKDTAGALHLHRHTVLYRLEKIGDLVDGKLDDPGVKLHLQLALELRKLI